MSLKDKIDAGFIRITELLGNKANRSDLFPYLHVDNKEQLKGIDKTLSEGWYTIAYLGDRYKQDGTSSGITQRAYASFIITERRGGQHQSIHFDAGHTYGKGNFINVLGMSSYDNPYNVIQQIRIIGKGTYDGALLQIYIKTTSTIDRIKMYNNLATSGWVLCSTPILSGSDEETGQLLPIVSYLSSMTQKCMVYLHNDYISMIASGDMRCRNIDVTNGAFISNRATSSNIDHIWHDDGNNTWYFLSDTAYKARISKSNVLAKTFIAESVQVGDAAPKIAFKKVTATYNNTVSSEKSFSHGLNGTKILTVKAVVKDKTGVYRPDGLLYSLHWNDLSVVLTGNQDAQLLNQSLTIFITYEV